MGVVGVRVGLFLSCLLLVSALAGCIQDPSGPGFESPQADEIDPDPATAVIADISPGVNPYHESFRRDWAHTPWDRIPGLPEDVTVLELTFGDDYASSRKADAEVWDSFETHTLYWVNGTNLLLYSDRPSDFLPDGNTRTFHGTGSADAVNQACPDCYVLVYQDASSIDGRPVRRITDEMPWVDIVTSTNIPGPYDPVFGQHDEATRGLWDTGRIYVSFSGNSVVTGLVNVNAPFPIHYVDFPPWVVTAGGAHSECGASDLLAGKPPEVVGNFTQRLADVETLDGYRWLSGTSFSTPQIAGMMGQTLAAVRNALGHDGTTGSLWTGDPVKGSVYLEDGIFEQAELRDAVSRAARYFSANDYDPGSCPPDVIGVGPVNLHALPASPTPWIEMGWGYLGHEEADLAAGIILGEAELPQKPDAARMWMDQYMALRETMYPW